MCCEVSVSVMSYLIVLQCSFHPIYKYLFVCFCAANKTFYGCYNDVSMFWGFKFDLMDVIMM